jgi:chalcone synthase
VELHISSNVERLVKAALKLIGGDKDPNVELFWVVHPGGRDILDRVESRLGLRKEKLQVARDVMRKHGNTLSSCMIIAMAEMRKRSEERSLATPGEGLEWRLLFGFGTELTV